MNAASYPHKPRNLKKKIHDLDDDINYLNNKNEELTSIILTMQKQNIDANKKYFFSPFFLFISFNLSKIS